ncbi:MAG: HAD-IA family hydrolase [Thermomicrobiales bacterium]|nr:HAD-IA family hydrolase [Thermomicrobiales bacterium]
MSRFRTAIFDLDGTLADTLPLIYEAFDAALRPVFGRRMDDAEVRALFGPPDNYIIRTIVPAAEQEAAFARYVATYEREHERLVTAFHGIDEVTRRAAAAGLKLGVVTGKSRQTALFTLEALGLLPIFGAIYAGDDVERQKPDPEAVVKILHDLGHDPATPGAFIGDSAADVIAGRAAGLITIAVTWGSPDHDQLHASSPDVIVHTSEELLSALDLN